MCLSERPGTVQICGKEEKPMKHNTVFALPPDEDLADTLTAISVVSKLLASIIRDGQKLMEEGGKTNGNNERTCCGAY